jgi:hypothetical protein
LVFQPLKSPFQLASDGNEKTTVQRVTRALERGCKRVQTYFGGDFTKSFRVILAPHRKEFDFEAHRRWKMPPTEKWMVGMGTSNLLLLLSPAAWKQEAVEHDGASESELEQIVAHELTHVFHAQMCPKSDFDDMDDMGWFVEGLAVVVSGQLDGPYKGVPALALQEGKEPESLAKACEPRVTPIC